MLGPVTTGCRQRLIAHYGGGVAEWLDRVPEVFGSAARSWGLSLISYHDAGHASALALAATDDGTQVMLKAWFDPERYRHETAALRHWEPVNGRIVLAEDDEQAAACLALVGGAPGGRPRPADDHLLVARALARVHAQLPPDHKFPWLEEYLHSTVEPRMLRRLRLNFPGVPRRCVDLGLNTVCTPACSTPVLLHADLYRENVPFGHQGQPVFLDPLPMVGDPAFDWAFFVVYFALADGPVDRLHTAAEASGIAVRVLLPWCLKLCLDGLLYYHEVGDGREARMVKVMIALVGEGGVA
jgi:streptomycin 6-kinase